MTLFETERLIVRRLSPTDVDAMFAIYGDLETVRYVGDSEPLSKESCLEWINITDRNFERRGYGMVAFVDRGNGEVIGCGGIVHPGQQEEPEVKYAFRRDLWGKGYASEAVIALLNHARNQWGVSRIIATADPKNTPSHRVLTKAGFTHLKDRVNEDQSLTQVWESLG